MKSYWRSVLFGVVVLVAIKAVRWLLPWGKLASLFGRSGGHVVSLVFNLVIVLAVFPILWKLFRS